MTTDTDLLALAQRSLAACGATLPAGTGATARSPITGRDLTTLGAVDAAAVTEAIIAEKLEQIEELIRSRLIKDAKDNLAALAARADLTDWVKQKVAYLQRLLEEDEVMTLKELRYGRRDMTMRTKAMYLADFNASAEPEVQMHHAVYHRKKTIAGQSTRRQVPTPPPAQPGPGANPPQP